MIIEKVTLYNVGAFRGWHAVEMDCTSTDENVVLVGALNGSGKTTLHEAIQVALYGKQSAPVKRKRGGYDRYIKTLINRDAKKEQGAVAELEFRHFEDGQERHFRVRRTWKLSQNSVREDLDVYLDGSIDKVLSDTWNDRVQDIFPTRIASLFFFDGEQIEELADFEKLPETLREAVYSLLGLDVVEQLRSDLDMLKRRKTSEVTKASEEEELTSLEQELAKVEYSLNTQIAEYNDVQKRLGLRGESIEEKMSEFEKIGGNLFEKFSELQNDKRSISAEIQELRKKLVNLAEAELPLNLLAGELLSRCEKSVVASVEKSQESERSRVISSRDTFLISVLQEYLDDADVIEGISSRLEQDRAQNDTRTSRDPEFEASDHDLAQFKVARRALPIAIDSAASALAELEKRKEELYQVERKLAAIPSEHVVAKVKGELESLLADVGTLEGTLARLEKDISSSRHSRSQIRKQLSQKVDLLLQSGRKKTEVQRMAHYSDWAKGALQEFGNEVVRHHISRIETLTLEAIQLLMRKEGFITDVSIDPSTFELSVFGNNRSKIDVRVLSAGERQLLATSLLWALARAAGQDFPTIIDTPLGRLDSHHRSRLVNYYFPNAGPQVVLLSTDEEINATHFETLKPKLSRSYTLSFNEEKSTTIITEGYEFAQELESK